MAINVGDSSNNNPALNFHQSALDNSKNSLDLSGKIADKTHQVTQDGKMKMAEMKWNRQAEQVLQTAEKMADASFKSQKGIAEAVG